MLCWSLTVTPLLPTKVGTLMNSSPILPAAISALIIVLTTGCAATEPIPAVQPLPAIHQYEPSDWDLNRYRESLEQKAESTGITNAPQIDIVRWINPEDAPSVMIGCLREAGVEATLETNGYSIESTGDQQAATFLADYICTAQYPLRLDIDRPISDDEFEIIYRHLTEEFIPCAKREGYSVGVPSRPQYRSAMRGESWDPIFTALTEEHGMTDAAVSDLMNTCPLRPENWRRYPT